MGLEADIAQCVEWLRSARRVLCITGAGISADSGLPTYRGIGGLYTDRHTEDEIPIEEALSAEMLSSNPELTWKYLNQIAMACKDAGYNPAHAAIKDLEDFCDVWILTQNIDGLHRSAGSQNVIEIHGSLGKFHCMGCGYAPVVTVARKNEQLPCCERCTAVLRPDVVLFGEMLPVDAVERLHAELRRGFDVVMSIGTTSVFPYIAGPLVDASKSGLPTIEINPAQTAVSGWVGLGIRQRAIKVLPEIIAGLRI